MKKPTLTVETTSVGPRSGPKRSLVDIAYTITAFTLLGCLLSYEIDRSGEVATMQNARVVKAGDHSGKLRYWTPGLKVEFTEGPLAGEQFTLRTQMANRLSVGDCVKVGVWPSKIASLLSSKPFMPESKLVDMQDKSFCSSKIKIKP